jgi:hypothetical protein
MFFGSERVQEIWAEGPWSKVHCKDTIPKIWNKYSQKRNCAVSVQISTFMCLWAILLFLWSVCLFCCGKIYGLILGIYEYLTDKWIWKLGLRPRNSLTWLFWAPNGNRLTARCHFTGPKKSRFPGPNPLPLALVMEMPLSKALHTGPYKS